jgi:hypothetical protein
MLLAGCTINPSATSIAHLLAPRNATIADGHADQAEAALARANAQACDAAAPFRAHAQLKAAEARGYSDQAQSIADSVRASYEQSALATTLIADIDAKLAAHQAEYSSALASFSRHFGEQRVTDDSRQQPYFHGGLKSSANVAAVMDDAGNYVYHLARHAHGLESIASRLGEDPAIAALDKWATPPQGLAALTGELTTASDDLLQATGRGYTTEFTVPADHADRNILVSQLDDSRSFDKTMLDLKGADSKVQALTEKLQGAQSWLEQVNEQIRIFGADGAEKTAGLADLANTAAADATANAWKAIEACGGEIPAEVADLLGDSYSPFGDQDTPSIPAWNSTFWSISSP